MDPLTLILDALAAGAAASAQTTASKAVKESYNGLKALLQRKFAKKSPQATLTLAERKKLQDELVKAGLDCDEEIIKKAQELMKLVSPQQERTGKFNVQTGDVQNQTIIQGDHVSLSIENKPKEK